MKKTEIANKAFTPIPRHRQRTFRLQIHVPPFDEYAWEVVNSIERTTIQVADPHDQNGLAEKFDSGGAQLIDSDAKLTVPLADWLAVGCQKIRWEREPEEKVLPNNVFGCYFTNKDVVFGRPNDESHPSGPSVFVGDIIISRKIQRAWVKYHEPESVTDILRMFQFIIAHELVHVFNNLKYLVPAFMDWRSFWKNILTDGSSTDILHSRMSDKSLFIDSYGEKNELECVRDWWPSRAESWFQARNLDWPKLLQSSTE